MLAALSLLAAAFGVLMNAPRCDPARPAPRAPEKEGPSRSLGRPSSGELRDGSRLPEEGEFVKILPARHRARRLNFAADELVRALENAGAKVAARYPGAILWMGNTAAPFGGSLAPYSVSHQSGLDADLALYVYDPTGAIAAPEDLIPLNATGASFDGALLFAPELEWALIAALLEDPGIKVKYLFLYKPLKALVLDAGRRVGAPEKLLRRADDLISQPSGAGPHSDHLHIRIFCPARQKEGCED
jgi:penicillin-insensitive murein endopeptidase